MARRGDIDSDEQEQDQGQTPADQGQQQEPDYSAEIADSIFQSMGAADDEADPDARAVGTGDKPRDDGGQPDDRTPGAAGQSADDDGGIPADKGSQDNAAGAQKGDDPEFLREPEGLAERSKARFQELATRYKERDTQYQELEQRYQQLEQHASAMIEEVRSTGATPEQFQRGLNYMALANKPDPSAQELQSVKQFLESELGAVNQKLGVVQGESEASQLLAAHPDLQQAVDNLEIDVKWAAQIAAQRNLHAQQQQAAQQRAFQEQQASAHAQQIQSVMQTGRDAVNQWVQAKMGSDPDARAIIEAIKPQIIGLAKVLPPHQWVRHLAQQYDVMKQFSVSRAAQQDPQPRKHEQALTGTGASAGRSAPKSVEHGLLQMFGHED